MDPVPGRKRPGTVSVLFSILSRGPLCFEQKTAPAGLGLRVYLSYGNRTRAKAAKTSSEWGKTGC